MENPEVKKGKNFDEILDQIGAFGRWQLLNFLMLSLTIASSGILVTSWVFTAYDMKHRCTIPFCENANNSYYYLDNSCNFVAHFDYTTFLYYLLICDHLSCNDYMNINIEDMNKTYCDQKDLIYDTSVVTSSLLKDFELACNTWAETSILGSSYMLGVLAGSPIVGFISDKFGRLKALVLSVIWSSLAGFAAAFAQDAVTFGILRFMTGIGGISIFIASIVMAMECVGQKYTMLVAIAIEIPFALGELTFGIEAYFVRDWRTLQMVAFGPILALALLWFCLPESPRWLMTVGQLEKARNIILKAAKLNKSNADEIECKDLLRPEDEKEQCKTCSTLEIPDSGRMAGRTLNMCYQWMGVTMCYYGLSLASTSLAGDPYVNYILSVLMEIPGYVFCLFVTDCWGRQAMLIFCQILSGIACILAGILFHLEELSGLQLFCSLIGKFGASSSFALLYLYTAELFPTAIRGSAIGTCSLAARFGGIAAFFIQQLNIVWNALPMLVMGISAIIGGVLAFFFPETLGNHLPETKDEALNIATLRERRPCSCYCPKKTLI